METCADKKAFVIGFGVGFCIRARRAAPALPNRSPHFGGSGAFAPETPDSRGSNRSEAIEIDDDSHSRFIGDHFRNVSATDRSSSGAHKDHSEVTGVAAVLIAGVRREEGLGGGVDLL